jgi:hypothetical protein
VIANWDNLLVAGARSGNWIPAVGDSDAHSEPQVIGLPHNVVYADDLDRRSILAGVRSGRVWITESADVGHHRTQFPLCSSRGTPAPAHTDHIGHHGGSHQPDLPGPPDRTVDAPTAEV